jgi:hypothetical protein
MRFRSINPRNHDDHGVEPGVELGEVGVTATFKRHADDSPRYQAGRGAGNRISRETGEACIKHFTDNCPI